MPGCPAGRSRPASTGLGRPRPSTGGTSPSRAASSAGVTLRHDAGSTGRAASISKAVGPAARAPASGQRPATPIFPPRGRGRARTPSETETSRSPPASGTLPRSPPSREHRRRFVVEGASVFTAFGSRPARSPCSSVNRPAVRRRRAPVRQRGAPVGRGGRRPRGRRTPGTPRYSPPRRARTSPALRRGGRVAAHRVRAAAGAVVLLVGEPAGRPTAASARPTTGSVGWPGRPATPRPPHPGDAALLPAAPRRERGRCATPCRAAPRTGTLRYSLPRRAANIAGASSWRARRCSPRPGRGRRGRPARR